MPTVIKRQSRAFTLLEVLVSGGILFIVASAVVGLSNSIIQGTSITNDTTITNRWAAEGLELTTKIRDDAVKQLSFSTGQAIWFAPAENVDNYGWYYLDDSLAPGTKWQLSNSNLSLANPNIIDITTFDFTKLPAQTKLKSDNLTANRLICIEAVGAQTLPEEGKISCNTFGDTEASHKKVSDGDRMLNSSGNKCDRGNGGSIKKNIDLFCLISFESINRNKLNATPIEIPDGNAVKVRSVVIWPDRNTFSTTDMATLLTNWKSLEQGS